MTRLRPLLVVLLASVPVALAALVGCGRSTPAAAPPTPSLPARRMASEGYAGRDACAPCHRDQHKAHGQSRHWRSLHVLTKATPATLAPRVGPIDRSDAEIVATKTGYALTISGEEGEPMPLDLVFGSGKSGATYVSVVDGELLEVHRSWFPPAGKWFVTPGHERLPAENVGMMYTAEQARTCVLCHATALPDDGLIPPPALRGIGCETCHGPGQEHVAAMKADPKGPLRIRKLAGAEPALVNAVCGQCHRSRAMVSGDNPEIGQTNRFQMVGMLQSRCYLESGRKLTCVTCHAPHTDTPKDPKPYEAACLSCHSAPKTVCPVNPSEKCVSCHMPSRPAFSSGSLPTKMADHFIRIWREGR